MTTILQGDCLDELRKFAPGSVELCVTSPPYGNLRSYKGKLQWDFEGVARELFRVLCVGGVLCWNVGDETLDGSESLDSCDQKIFFRRECRFLIHDTMIYEKVNFSNPSHNRYHQVFEYVFVFSKGGAPRAWNPILDKPNKYGTCLGKNTFRAANGEMKERAKNRPREFGMRHNVWRLNTRGQEEMCAKLPHPAMMPRALARDLIISWSNVGDTVLDPFGGSGTTGEEALKVGRKAIIIEKEPEYANLIRRNLANTTPGLPLADKP